jgi:hypothetical protein
VDFEAGLARYFNLPGEGRIVEAEVFELSSVRYENR